MSRKKATTGISVGVFLVFVVMVAFWGMASADEAVSTEAAETADAGAPANDVVLYYFHGTRRCRTCMSIESYAKEAIEEAFPDRLESGDLQWKVVNFEKKNNRHFVEAFGLVSSSLVVVEATGDEVARFQVLNDAWTLVRKKDKFIDYVQGSVRGYLE